MYADFFGFRELPFNNTPDPRFFYSTPDHEEALASLIYAVRERKGFVLLTGEVGTGKTLVTRMMLRHFGTRIAFATVNHAMRTHEDLMESICTEFELSLPEGASSTQLVRILHDYLLTQFARNIPVVLVLDEAQNLTTEGFEQLRMIGNLEADDAKLLQIAIVGQPELQQMFRTRELRQIRQRLFRSFHLPALSREHTEGYIRHRLHVATEGEDVIFDTDAMEAVYRYAGGLPRLINTVCDNALLSAYSADRKNIDRSFVDSVISQMMVTGITDDDLYGSPAAQFSRWFGAPQAPPGGCGAPSRPRADAFTQPPYRPSLGEAAAERIEHTAQHYGRGPWYGEQPYAPTPAYHPGVTAESIEAVREIARRELAPVVHEARATVADAMQRVTALEQQVRTAQGQAADARAAQTALGSILRQTRQAIARAESASTKLEKKEGQLGQVGESVRNTVGNLKQLLDRARKTAAQVRLAQDDARLTLRRLQAKTGRTSAGAVTAAGEAPARGAVPAAGAPKGRLSTKSNSREVRQMLERTLESASRLRTLTTDKTQASDSTTAPHQKKDTSTSRLARQVDELLDQMTPKAVAPC